MKNALFAFVLGFGLFVNANTDAGAEVRCDEESGATIAYTLTEGEYFSENSAPATFCDSYFVTSTKHSPCSKTLVAFNLRCAGSQVIRQFRCSADHCSALDGKRYVTLHQGHSKLFDYQLGNAATRMTYGGPCSVSE